MFVLSPLKLSWQFQWILDIFLAYQNKSIIILGCCPHAHFTEFMPLRERRMLQILFHQILPLTTYILQHLIFLPFPAMMHKNENGAIVHILQINVQSVFKNLWIFLGGDSRGNDFGIISHQLWHSVDAYILTVPKYVCLGRQEEDTSWHRELTAASWHTSR